MAEEDEIDIMGDFILDRYDAPSLVSENTELLNLDYTIHPQWLLDKPSTNPENWYGTNLSSGLIERSHTENDNLGLVSTEDSITDESGWTEKEKNLLERGIEIFGKSNVRLAQFVGSKTATEVKYYLKNFYVDSTTTYRLNEGVVEEISENNLISDIPVSVEEVITVVSTAKPTVVGNKKTRKKKDSNSGRTTIFKNISSGQSVLKSNNTTKDLKTPKESKPKQQRTKLTKAVKFKFTVTTKQKEIKQKTVKVMNVNNKKAELGRVEITTGAGLSVPVCEGEEVVTLNRAPNEDDSDQDLEIDVEETDDIPFKPTESNSSLELAVTQNNEVKIIREAPPVKPEIDLDGLDEITRKQLTSMEEPSEEVVFKDEEITGLERIIHGDFFEGSQAKTPKRYLKIRNHILNMWEMEKPSYVTKTSTRQGLKNCGDVNCIGRVHTFLEQIGAINFGCSQINYVRPLSDMIQVSTPSRENKQLKTVTTKPTSVVGSRQRIKRKLNNDGEGGCTMTHDASGKVISTTIVNEEPVQRQKTHVRKAFIKLINCKSFTEDHPQKYSIKLHLSTLLLMDFHAHSSLTEIMGLIGGHWLPEQNTLKISHYQPCKNIASSATHCDMCPISQAKASDLIHGKDLDILGWFHSHPTFIPEPSQQDLDTQKAVQTWIGNNKPCLGFILSPFSSNGALIASPYRCMMVEKKLNFEDQFVPYKYRVELVTNGFDVEKFLDEVRGLFRENVEEQGKMVDFTKPYFQDGSITYLDKFLSSVRMYLAKSSSLNHDICDSIIEGISRIFED